MYRRINNKQLRQERKRFSLDKGRTGDSVSKLKTNKFKLNLLNMSAVESLRKLINERLTAAAEEILGVCERTIVVYEEEVVRQRKLLDILLKPEIKLHRTGV